MQAGEKGRKLKQGLGNLANWRALAILALLAMAPTAHAQVCPDDMDGDPDTECSSNPNFYLPKNLGGATSDKTPDPSSLPRVADPIDIGFGNKTATEVDYSTKGPSPLVLSRSYNAMDNRLTSMGIGWRSTYSRFIVLHNTGECYNNPTSSYMGCQPYLYITRGDGKMLTFYLNSQGQWWADSDINARLASTSSGGYVYTTGDDEIETYNAAGQLISVTNRAGMTQTMSYDANGHMVSVTDQAGRSLTFSYTGSLLTSVTAPDGGVYQYAYDAFNNLAKVTYPDLTFRTLVYENAAYPHARTGVYDENGSRYSTDTYDSAGRDTSTQLAGGVNKVSVDYISAAPYILVTEPLNLTYTYALTKINNSVPVWMTRWQSCSTCTPAIPQTSSTSYNDANGNLVQRTEYNGNTTCYLADFTRNLETKRLEGVPPGAACPNLTSLTSVTGAERVISTQWNAAYRLPAKVAEPLRITSYTYDAQGNLLTRTIQPTSDATGVLGFTASAAGTARTWTYTYNVAGQLLTADGPRTDVADVTTYTYDSVGNLITVTNALNQTTTLGAYDVTGRVGSITDPNGLVTSLTYDARGRLTSRNSGGETTTDTYDGASNLTGVTLPSGASYTYTYDAAHRLTQIADAQNNKIVYTLDNAGNRTREQVYNSAGTIVQTHSRAFDALSRLVQDIGAVNQTTTYTYDASGNLLTVTDPLNRHTTNVYDPLNRLNQVTNPDTGVVKYAYDGLSQLASVTDPRNLATQYTRDGLGNLAQQQSPDTSATSATYDAAGNVLTRTDAKGQTATYTYDALNRVTSITYTGGTATPQTIAYQYDQGANGIGRVTQITDSTGVTAYAYDLHGRVTTKTVQAYGGTYATAYAYDANGRLSGIGYPSGRVIVYAFDTQGRVNQISAVTGGNITAIASNITYEPFGGVHSFAYGDGVTAPVQTYTRQRDQDGRIASYTLNGGRTLSLLYDAASQITTLSDSTNLANPASYGYDPMSRLNSYIQGATSQGYSYDVDGNRTSQTIGATATTYGLGTTSNWLTSTTVGTASPQTVSHDPNGATTADATRQYAYDLRGRLTQTTTAQGAINYEINALGLRTRKQVPYANTDTLYHYDLQGHLIGENPNGQTQYREYVWLGDIPVAVLQ